MNIVELVKLENLVKEKGGEAFVSKREILELIDMSKNVYSLKDKIWHLEDKIKNMQLRGFRLNNEWLA